MCLYLHGILNQKYDTVTKASAIGKREKEGRRQQWRKQANSSAKNKTRTASEQANDGIIVTTMATKTFTHKHTKKQMEIENVESNQYTNTRKHTHTVTVMYSNLSQSQTILVLHFY